MDIVESAALDLPHDFWEPRERDILELRRARQTLHAIGRKHGLTGERVRQISRHAEARLIAECDQREPRWRTATRAFLDEALAVPEADFACLLVREDGLVLDALLREAGAVRPRFWRYDATGYWTSKTGQLRHAMTELISGAPYQGHELGPRAESLGIPAELPCAVLLGGVDPPLIRTSSGTWVRRRSKRTDSAYLWMLDEGEERTAEEIAEALGDEVRAVNAAMRKDDRFQKVPLERTWSLTSWASGRGTPYGDTLEAMLAVLTEHGPVTQKELFSEVTSRYPVSYARLRQCLLSDRLGVLDDGRFDLVERGAVHFDEPEPRRPSNMVSAADDNVIGVVLKVDADMVAGNGIPVHNWLTWRLGLRSAPMKKSFAFNDGGKPLIVSRNTGGAQLSTLRARVTALGTVPGCLITVAFHLSTSTASINHTCGESTCAARGEESNH
ncbi:sigma factor-like helix-turn-helix DNA-binding protein [Actinokineospora spheciospongiae]|uniref:sigma factor-like helix-turn-helix DNA-binding protein n=1 Tax=Actinokineospora spheciospongiae TaxID=909613 RepID=UPI00068E35AC|nr:sigma factor-like helix-turn-helix DNA-binding protein [Actinokineospora spheciospongiae]